MANYKQKSWKQIFKLVVGKLFIIFVSHLQDIQGRQLHFVSAFKKLQNKEI